MMGLMDRQITNSAESSFSGIIRKYGPIGRYKLIMLNVCIGTQVWSGLNAYMNEKTDNFSYTCTIF